MCLDIHFTKRHGLRRFKSRLGPVGSLVVDSSLRMRTVSVDGELSRSRCFNQAHPAGSIWIPDLAAAASILSDYETTRTAPKRWNDGSAPSLRATVRRALFHTDSGLAVHTIYSDDGNREEIGRCTQDKLIQLRAWFSFSDDGLQHVRHQHHWLAGWSRISCLRPISCLRRHSS